MNTNTPVEINQNKNTFHIHFSWLIPWIFGLLFTYGYVGFAHDYASWTVWQRIADFVFSFFFYPLILGWKLSGRVGLFN